MLATDDKSSVLSQVSEQGREGIAYSVYGYDEEGSSHLGYNAELRDSLTGQYFLGKGYRMYDPRLMRFQCPDGVGWSPFGEGGMNGYAYVLGNPVKDKDPSGHGVLKLLSIALMLSPQEIARSRLNQTGFAASHELSGWTMHSMPGLGAVEGAAGGTSEIISLPPVATTSGRARHSAIQSGTAVLPKDNPVKKIQFNKITEVYEYKQRMKPEHWTTKADELNATKEVMQELGVEPDIPTHSSNSSARPDTSRTQARIRSTKAPSVISQARNRRNQ